MQTARRSGGRRGIGSPGGDSGTLGRRSRVAQRRWQYTPLLTAPPKGGGGGGGGGLGKLWKYASPGKGKGVVLLGYLLQQPRDGASASSMRGTIAAVLIAEDMGWIPPTVAPIHKRLAKVGGDQTSNFTFRLVCSRKRRVGGGIRRGAGGPWWHSCAFGGSPSFGLERLLPSG